MLHLFELARLPRKWSEINFIISTALRFFNLFFLRALLFSEVYFIPIWVFDLFLGESIVADMLYSVVFFFKFLLLQFNFVNNIWTLPLKAYREIFHQDPLLRIDLMVRVIIFPSFLPLFYSILLIIRLSKCIFYN